ncbi:hypothetical protein GCM10010517_06470 [Streptosporangium fragile]|uniref:ABC3 transporter permease C-terminal domain-containing protein n=1 Tax=Streptosporangium fragile TaxID=46186 RepID=A0ABN3VQ41_9ACTN
MSRTSGERPVSAESERRTAGAGRSPLAAFRAALRISRRGIGRARARSALIMVMIGLPVLLVTVLATWRATDDVDSREGLNWHIGAADAQVRAETSGRPIWQSVDGAIRGIADPVDTDGAATYGKLTERQVRALFEPGARMVPAHTGWTGYRVAGSYREADLREIDLRDPITTGMYRLLSGRLPRTPGEVAVSPALGLREGTALPLTRTGGTATVVGVVEPQRAPGHPEIVALPGSALADGKGVSTDWLVDTPAPVTWERVREINRHGVVVVSRAVINDPPPEADTGVPIHEESGNIVGVLEGALGMAVVVLEVVFLAGPAFAVGIRRRRRELALVAAQGGSPRHLRAVVLADGLTLGLTASVLGAGAGVGVAAAVTPFVHRGPFEVPFGWVALTVLLGTASALLAAVVPAVQASRADTAAALAARRAPARDRRGLPLLGLLLALGGLAVIGYDVVAGSERWDPTWSSSRIRLLAGAVLGQLGLVLLTPWLVGAAARLAARLPLPFRMAARDAARNRGRTAPAVAAVLAATAAFAALGVVTSSQLAYHRETYVPRYMTGSTVVDARVNPEMWREIRRTVTSLLPGVPLIEVGQMREVGYPFAELRRESGCEHCVLSFGSFGEIAVGGTDLLRHFLRGPDPDAEAALAAGKAVVFDPRLARDGTLSLEARGPGMSAVGPVPAVVRRPPGEVPVLAMLSATAVAKLGATVDQVALVADPAVLRVTPEQEERLDAAVRAVSRSASVTVERGFQSDNTVMLLVLALGAAVLVLGGTFAATGLAAAEARPDRATLAAVGATGRVQRLLVAGQAAFIAGLGVSAGTLAGLVVGLVAAVGERLRGQDLVRPANDLVAAPAPLVVDVPWLALAGVLAGLPLLAALLAGVCVRTGVVLTRRLA